VLRSHVIEPKYPLALERYINLGDFADIAGIKKKKEKLVSLFDEYGNYHKRVFRLVSCAAALESELFELGLSGISLNRVYKKAEGIISREIKGRGGGADTKKRFLSAVSPQGHIVLFDTLVNLGPRVFVLENNFGLGHFLLLPVLKAAENAGYKCYVCCCPLSPERMEHLIIPELELSFVSSTKSRPFPFGYHRKIRMDAMIQPEVIKDKKQKITFSRKLIAALIEEACDTLSEAKGLHDEIEAEYNPHINFDAVYSLADKTSEEILNT
jgi:hypothetical protein